MASIRTFALKFPMKSRTATTASFGWRICFIAVLISSVISLAHFLETQVAHEDVEWECHELLSNETSSTVHFMVPSTLAEWNNFYYLKIRIALDSIFSKQEIEENFREIFLPPDVLEFLTSFTTLTHFPICLAMSTQYRSTVLGLLRFKNSFEFTVFKPATITGAVVTPVID
ncbi:Protein CBG07850 [Caenorhabditis briggsae]|uniref:Protein CBG07850 n=1 Tax=Caenorhabditis briggsae TaxID=6238 RepID=A8X597_CAEBR|nr:Protein CBG07850 [Caenorhabditis briggsae]CAP27796.2 Protein CBG07850 [Caenorhabditis briggsae]